MTSSDHECIGEAHWDILEQAEAKALRSIDELVSDFLPIIRAIFACGTLAPFLSGGRAHTQDMIIGALFLKKTLNDLRATWLLIIRGYTSQACTVAASLFENALAAACVAGDEQRAREWLSAKDGELLWTVSKLCKILSVKQKPGRDPDEARRMGHDAYPQYKWLCKVKHPTLASAFHDAGSARGPGNTFVVTALPDTRPENIPVKANVLMVCALRTLEVVEQFAQALGSHDKTETWNTFEEKIKSADAQLTALIRKHTRSPLPFRL